MIVSLLCGASIAILHHSGQWYPYIRLVPSNIYNKFSKEDKREWNPFIGYKLSPEELFILCKHAINVRGIKINNYDLSFTMLDYIYYYASRESNINTNYFPSFDNFVRLPDWGSHLNLPYRSKSVELCSYLLYKYFLIWHNNQNITFEFFCNHLEVFITERSLYPVLKGRGIFQAGERFQIAKKWARFLLSEYRFYNRRYNSQVIEEASKEIRLL